MPQTAERCTGIGPWASGRSELKIEINVDENIEDTHIVISCKKLTPEMEKNSNLTIPEREKKIVSGLKSMLGIKADVKVVEPKSIARSEGKAVRVIDKRHLYQ